MNNLNCGEPYNFQTFTYSYPTKKIKRITRTIEKYAPSGEYLGREIITEDLEDIEVPDYSQQPFTQPQFYNFPTICDGTITLSGTGEVVSFEGNVCSTGTQINTPFTYTSKN